MAGAPSHADDWRCPLHCHSMTVPRLLKIDGGELGQKKAREFRSKNTAGPRRRPRKDRVPNRPRGHTVKLWRYGSGDPICLRLDAMRFLLCRKERKSQPPLTQMHTDEFVYFDRFFPRKRQYISWWQRQTPPRSRYWLFKVRWYVCFFFLSCITLLFSRVIQK